MKILKLIQSIKLTHNQKLIAICLFFTVLFAIIVSFVYRIPGSDDTIILDLVVDHPNAIDWTIHRYGEWGGRFGAEFIIYTFGKLSVFYFQLASVVFYFMTSVLLFGCYKLFNKDQQKQDYLMLTLAFLLPYIMNYNVLISGGICITGAINYAWIVSIGLMAFYPIIYFLANKSFPNWIITVASFICLIIASSGQEQVGILLICFILLALAYYLYLIKTKQQKLSKNSITLLLLFFFTALLSLIINLKAPGNEIRMVSEVARWQPDFYTTPLFEHAQYSYRWFLEAVINHSGLLVEGIIVTCSYLLFRKKRRSLLEKVFLGILILSSILFIFKDYYSINMLFNFFPVWKVKIDSLPILVMPLLWIPIILTSITAPIVIFKNRKGLFISIVILASYLSAAMMVISPTMYGSGWRIIYVPSVMFGIAFGILVNEVVTLNNKFIKPILITLLTLFSISFIYLLLRFIVDVWFVY